MSLHIFTVTDKFFFLTKNINIIENMTPLY